MRAMDMVDAQPSTCASVIAIGKLLIAVSVFASLALPTLIPLRYLYFLWRSYNNSGFANDRFWFEF